MRKTAKPKPKQKHDLRSDGRGRPLGSRRASLKLPNFLVRLTHSWERNVQLYWSTFGQSLAVRVRNGPNIFRVYVPGEMTEKKKNDDDDDADDEKGPKNNMKSAAPERGGAASGTSTQAHGVVS